MVDLLINKKYIKVYESDNTVFIYEVNGVVANLYNHSYIDLG